MLRISAGLQGSVVFSREKLFVSSPPRRSGKEQVEQSRTGARLGFARDVGAQLLASLLTCAQEGAGYGVQTES